MGHAMLFVVTSWTKRRFCYPKILFYIVYYALYGRRSPGGEFHPDPPTPPRLNGFVDRSIGGMAQIDGRVGRYIDGMSSARQAHDGGSGVVVVESASQA